MNYAEYLKTDHWNSLRKSAILSEGRKCAACSARHSLEVHHLNYRKWFDVEVNDLIALCGACHSRAHAWLNDSPFQNKEASSEDKREELLSYFGELFETLGQKRNKRALRQRKAKVRNKRRLGHLMEELASHGVRLRE